MKRLFRRVQLVARVRDWNDARLRRGWYAPAGTYDGSSEGRPFRHLRCIDCGGPHFGPHR
jgi:hypothetical protein